MVSHGAATQKDPRRRRRRGRVGGGGNGEGWGGERGGEEGKNIDENSHLKRRKLEA